MLGYFRRFFLALLPVVPILECGLYMAFGGSVQPAAAAWSQIALYMGDCFRTAEVYVRGFPAHVVEQPGLVLFLGEEESTHRLEKRSAFVGTN